ncbi:MAG: hypothetical protein GC162_14365 [Planctomycetes bacterium]|nr:hypothetical protein [Planctomycetota bacterium]
MTLADWISIIALQPSMTDTTDGVASVALAVTALAVATFVSEDLTCITAGLMIARGDVPAGAAIAGCLAGIYLGDLGLYALGRGGSSWLFRRSRTTGRVTMASVRHRLDSNLPAALFTARFAPGLRLPTYVAAGLGRISARRFAGWTLLAAAIWTPLLVLAAAFGGTATMAALERWLGGGWLLAPCLAALVVLTWRLINAMRTTDGRARMMARVSKLWRWEFWPAWVFYAPLGPWFAWLWLRYGGPTTLTAANPAIRDGGFVGESKCEILSLLPADSVPAWQLIAPGAAAERVKELRTWMSERSIAWPIILKPDTGQRGAGVRKVASPDEAVAYLAVHTRPIVAQAFHPGPLEAGVFYYRLPNESHGHIYSITDKIFAAIEGDGTSTLESLIRHHPRYRMQAATFLSRLGEAAATVPTAGERIALAMAGNHCQGTMFRDGADLITPDLERAIDRIARSVDGFYIGRFDVRYTDRAAFMAGRDLTIIELNGVTSESTNVYDPSRSLIWAYRTLGKQWALAYRIGALNRQRGGRVTSFIELVRTTWSFYRNRDRDLRSD